MKFIATSLFIAIVGLLCGCANLPLPLAPAEVDPQLVAVDHALKDDVVKRFLAYVKLNPHIIGMDITAAAKGLEDRAESNRLNLRNTRKLYVANRTDANKTLLLRAKEIVDIDRGIAESALNGQMLPNSQGMGAPFAPPLGVSPPPPAQQTIVVNQQDQIVTAIRELQKTVAQIGHMVWTNQQARIVTNVSATATNIVVTNAVPPAPSIPGK